MVHGHRHGKCSIIITWKTILVLFTHSLSGAHAFTHGNQSFVMLAIACLESATISARETTPARRGRRHFTHERLRTRHAANTRARARYACCSTHNSCDKVRMASRTRTHRVARVAHLTMMYMTSTFPTSPTTHTMEYRAVITIAMMTGFASSSGLPLSPQLASADPVVPFGFGHMLPL